MSRKWYICWPQMHSHKSGVTHTAALWQDTECYIKLFASSCQVLLRGDKADRLPVHGDLQLHCTGVKLGLLYQERNIRNPFYLKTQFVPYSKHTLFAKGQAIYVQRSTEACSRNNCCGGKAISITCLCVCVCAYVNVALAIRHAKHMHRVVICGLSGCTVFFDIINGTIFVKKVIEHEMCFDFLYNFYHKNF